MTYEIFETNLGALLARIDKLNAKLSRIGAVPAVVKTLGTKDVARPGQPNVIDRVVTIEVNTTTPTTPNGWAFVAKIVHTPDGNIVNHVPGTTDIPAGYREGKPCCDHCRTNRFRRDTYIVSRGTDTKQVGSSCLEEFLGTKNPQTLCTAMEMVVDLHDVCDTASKSGLVLDRKVSRVPLVRYLGYVAELVIKEGTYVTRAAAQTKGNGDFATARRAYRMMFEYVPNTNPPVMMPVSAEAAALAETAREFVLNKFAPQIPDLNDPNVDIKALILNQFSKQDGLSDFEHNLYTISRSESIEPRLCGIAGYIIEFYRREQSKAKSAVTRTAAPVLSAEGMPRIFAMFDNAAKHLKRVAINLATEQTHIHLSLAGAKSKNPGCIYVKASAGFNAPYYGKITKEGRFFSVRECPATVEPLLLDFAKNPEEVAAKSGKLTGRCSFCNRPLSDDRSTEVGYGPVCAERMGLKWGLTEHQDMESSVHAEEHAC